MPNEKVLNSSDSLLQEEIRALQAELATVKQASAARAQALSKSVEQFSLAMRGANDGLWDWDFETDEVYYSPRWKSMLGYDENELDNTFLTWERLVHPDDKYIIKQQAQEYVDGCATSFEVEMRMYHKDGRLISVLSRAFLVIRESDNKPVRLVGTHVDITERKSSDAFDAQNTKILEMIAIGRPAPDIYNAIGLMYEILHPGMRCSMLELHGNKLMHGGAPSLPKAYCDAVNGLENGPSVGSCGTSTYTGRQVLVENIDTDPKWEKIKHIALPHGMRCCWSEPIKSSQGDVLGAFGMYYDYPALPNEKEAQDLKSAGRLTSIVMERDHNQKQIRTLAYTDELTGLPNRSHFYQHLKTLITTSSGQNNRFALLYIDLDDFKGVNDSLGHDAGDMLLQSIAARLKTACREKDFIARLSGDEFCVLATEVDGHGAVDIAQRCLDTIAQPMEISARLLTPACSIGIAHFPEDGDDAATLTKAADTSLYAAKENGKNRYALYHPELTRQAEYRFQVEQYLRYAIENHELSLVYQPQVDLLTGKIIGVEALSRWHHPQLGEVSPVDFIATAERIGMIKTHTEWVLNTACRQLVAWQQAGFLNLQMAVNISPTHFLDRAIVPMLRRIIDETGIAPEQLELEVTEGVVQTDPKNLSIFRDLKNLGIQLAIDDFGTGYSSLASLKHMTVDCLKIDKHFIDDILTDKEALLLVTSMIDIGHKLGHSIIAEGVESADQVEILKKLSCESAQGYFFSKPDNAATIAKLLN